MLKNDISNSLTILHQVYPVSLCQRHHGMRVLNNHEQLEMWKPILNDYFELERKHIFPRL